MYRYAHCPYRRKKARSNGISIGADSGILNFVIFVCHCPCLCLCLSGRASSHQPSHSSMTKASERVSKKPEQIVAGRPVRNKKQTQTAADFAAVQAKARTNTGV